jgi:pyruvate dehydrogenase E1 component alpha subunit
MVVTTTPSSAMGSPTRLLEGKLVSEDDIKAIDAEIRAIITEAAEFAQNDPEPDESELWTDVLIPA